MKLFAPMASRAPRSTGGVTTRAHLDDDTAEPPVSTGFNGIMAQNRILQADTHGATGREDGPGASGIDRTLREHHRRLGQNIALLEQRYEKSPAVVRPAADGPGQIDRRVETSHLPVPGSNVERLSRLVTEHVRAIDCIETLLAENADGQRGELILSELASNHAEMATELAMLVADDESARVSRPIAADRIATTEGNWENEGGHTRGGPRGSL